MPRLERQEEIIEDTYDLLQAFHLDKRESYINAIKKTFHLDLY